MTDEQDWTDPAFVTGAVLAQVENLTPEQQCAVLAVCLAQAESDARQTGCYACGNRPMVLHMITLTCLSCRAVQPERDIVRRQRFEEAKAWTLQEHGETLRRLGEDD